MLPLIPESYKIVFTELDSGIQLYDLKFKNLEKNKLKSRLSMPSDNYCIPCSVYLLLLRNCITRGTVFNNTSSYTLTIVTHRFTQTVIPCAIPTAEDGTRAEWKRVWSLQMSNSKDIPEDYHQIHCTVRE